jgi:hypothetical protein
MRSMLNPNSNIQFWIPFISAVLLVPIEMRTLRLKFLTLRKIRETPTSSLSDLHKIESGNSFEFVGMALSQYSSPVSGAQCAWWQFEVIELKSSGPRTPPASVPVRIDIPKEPWIFFESNTAILAVRIEGTDIPTHTSFEWTSILDSTPPLELERHLKSTEFNGKVDLQTILFQLNPSFMTSFIERILPHNVPLYLHGEIRDLSDFERESLARLKKTLRFSKPLLPVTLSGDHLSIGIKAETSVISDVKKAIWLHSYILAASICAAVYFGSHFF